MSAKDERLRQALKTHLAGDFATIAATVLEVDRANLTVDVQPLNGGAEMFGVRLRAAIDGDRGGMVLLPKEGSTVLVSAVNDNWNSAYVAMVSEVDLITLKTGDESLKKILTDMLAAIRSQVFTTNNGPTIKLINDPQFAAIVARLDNLFLD